MLMVVGGRAGDGGPACLVIKGDCGFGGGCHQQFAKPAWCLYQTCQYDLSARKL